MLFLPSGQEVIFILILKHSFDMMTLSVSVICRLVSPCTKRCLSPFLKSDLQVLDEIIEALSGFLWSGSELPIVNPSGETRAARFATYLTLLASAHLIISKFANCIPQTKYARCITGDFGRVFSQGNSPQSEMRGAS